MEWRRDIEVIPPGGDPDWAGRMRVLAHHQLPRGFLLHLDNPPHPPATPRPSSTLALIRKGTPAMEVLLLKRSPRSGFIPGAWVFPGGGVDQEDGDPALISRIRDLTQERARNLLGLPDSRHSAVAYWVAALRETFEETGILLCHGGEAAGTLPQDDIRLLEEHRTLARSALLAGEMSFKDVLERLDSTLDAGAVAYVGHWLTPECEPRRYDTRFFLAEVPPDARVTPHEEELVEALWITPTEALARNREGGLPLVLPTLSTLEELAPYSSPQEAVGQLEGRPVPLHLPRPERAEGGVIFHLEG